MHIHLDLVGGLSGDMFIGAILDCFPDLAESLSQRLVDAGFRDLVSLSIEPADDGTLTGTKFTVSADQNATGHAHRHYSEIREILAKSSLDEPTRDAALAVFRLLAEAEATVHGKRVDEVAFHEVGAWDSIADVVCAASLITAIDATGWSVSALPLGGGRVKTAHGLLPVPAPATALMLEQFRFVDDGVEGERITPTGAAILKFLSPAQTGLPDARLTRSGFGFGSKRFPGVPNVARAMVFDERQASDGGSDAVAWRHDQVLVMEFEVDDQTPEELADGLERLRGLHGVMDVTQSWTFGKKGRQMMSVRVLAAPDREIEITRAIFEQTTTLGIRRQVVTRSILERTEKTIEHHGRRYEVKVAARPGGMTAKTAIDDVADPQSTWAERNRLRHDIADRAIDEDDGHD